MLFFSAASKAYAAAGGNFYSLVILVLPAVRILGGRPGTALVGAGLGTQHF